MSIHSVIRSRPFLAVLILGVALLIAAGCGDNGEGGETPAGETPAAGETPSGGATTAEVKMVPTIQFDQQQLTIAADSDVTITAENEDDSLPHNFAVFASQAAAEGGEDPIAQTEICNAPCTGEVTVNLTAGEYYFRCQVHPTQMTGTLIAQ